MAKRRAAEFDGRRSKRRRAEHLRVQRVLLRSGRSEEDDLSLGDPRQRENVSISPRRVARFLSMDAGKADTPIDNTAVSTVPASRVADKNALNSNEEDDNN
ncbi:hypothetical protein PPTG_04999 [Phytophthora nicotianae INRA-310]|uniref:Uncharacterized protein n=1 Tax=Phytophthora nicotianae (strain INRA-310) TaxID=761204 RepID=W2QVE0_PHYN3|nr:hypothetical protein PPTG_04999 [Phytophthora nicotianae INRA-310]ETN17098.1 hypothetical protein PPTG_04999 [Phytophthora nicotianae INRA-310]